MGAKRRRRLTRRRRKGERGWEGIVRGFCVVKVLVSGLRLGFGKRGFLGYLIRALREGQGFESVVDERVYIELGMMEGIHAGHQPRGWVEEWGFGCWNV